MTNPEDIKKLVGEITDFVNSYNADRKQFIIMMSREHRTLQQSFTRLVLEWLEHVASGDYIHDDRNKASHEIARDLIEIFKARKDEINPSQFLPLI
jgi:hypothetical protein